jgi:predicted chitinase
MTTKLGSTLLLSMIGAMLAACGGGGDGSTSTDSLNSSSKQMVRSQKDATCVAWVSGGTYTAGEVVTYNGSTYTALVNQTDYAGAGWNPTVGSLYQAGGTCSGAPSPTPTPTPTPTPIPTPTPSPGGCTYSTWTYGADYPKGPVVLYPANGNYYLEVNNGTNGSDGTDPTISTWYWQPTTCSGGGTTPTPTPSSGFVVSQSQFSAMFPNANGFYTYANLVTALAKYPAFATTGNSSQQLQEAAAFFANVSHETGGLVYINEIAQDVYCGGGSYACAPGQEYYGRGPLQISWNYNYGAAGAALGLDLIDNPGLVATDGVVTWETALWYWMTQSGNAGVTPHNAMVNGSNFGQTINAINGGIECGQAPGSIGYQEMQDRVSLYTQFTNLFGVSTGGTTGC